MTTRVSIPFVIRIYNNRNTFQSLKNDPTIRPSEYQLGISTTLWFCRKKYLSRPKESRIAYREGDQEKMNYYAEGIQKFERQLGRSTVSSLSDILKAVQQQPGQTKRVNNQFDVV